MIRELALTILAAAGIGLCTEVFAATCNPKARSHQSKAAEIYMMLKEFDRLPTQEDQDFVLCMIEEKEDKQDFQSRVKKLKEKRHGQSLKPETQNSGKYPPPPTTNVEHKASADYAMIVARTMIAKPFAVPQFVCGPGVVSNKVHAEHLKAIVETYARLGKLKPTQPKLLYLRPDTPEFDVPPNVKTFVAVIEWTIKRMKAGRLVQSVENEGFYVIKLSSTNNSESPMDHCIAPLPGNR